MRHLRRARIFARGIRIAVYSPIDGELDPSPAARYAARIGCRLYVPRILDLRRRRMEFVELRFGCGIGGAKQLVARATMQRRIDPRSLDVVLVPLVAFDLLGHRLGFGAGFYDRKFAFLRRAYRTRPLLIGIGYEFQRVDHLVPSPWDVSLHAVTTERGMKRCRRILT